MLKIIGGIIIAWGVLDFGLSWMGTNLYSEIGIQLPDVIYSYTALIAIGLGSVINFIGKERTTEKDNTAQKDAVYVEQGDLSEKGIQEVLDNFIPKSEEVGSHFIYTISGSENIYAQGFRIEDNNYSIEVTGKNYLTNPDIIDTQKYKELILLGWNVPDEGENFNCEVTVKDCLDGKTAKLLFESLKLFDLSEDQINVYYVIE